MRYRILCVDDETANLRLLERLFREHYEVITASSGSEALELLQVHDFAVIITDQRMPAMTGMEFLKRAAEMRRQTVRMMLTGYTDAETLVEAVNSGIVYKYITKPWINSDLLATVKRSLQHYETMKAQRSLQLHNERLQGKLKATKDAFVNVVSGMLDLKDELARAHAERTRDHAISVAKEMKLEHADFEVLSLAAYLHEIPLFRLPQPIVRKNGAFTLEERALIEKHFENGLAIIESVPDLEAVASVLRYLFEHYDGSGMPHGFAQDQIPLIARIVSVADAYDTARRPRGNDEPLSTEDALRSLLFRSGREFDPAVVKAICEVENATDKPTAELDMVFA
ncbi:MAG: HD domain-containing phosphohydrolase [Pyrinomonadaceae bacterium]